jgi:hypothetical protein
MDTEEADLNPTPAQTDSAQTSESVGISKSEEPSREGPFVHEKSADRVKEVYSSGRGEPSFPIAKVLLRLVRLLGLTLNQILHPIQCFP